jgi:dolichol-phosphate mannosyltransferase
VPDVLVAVVTYNEGEKLPVVVGHFPESAPYQILIVDDGSTDGSLDQITRKDITILRHNANRGVGAAIRTAIEYGRNNGYRFMVIMAGNGKMQPEEIPRLTQPLIENQADYVQGSRYLPGGRAPNLPFFRTVMIRLYTWLVWLLTGFRGTDVTCGFRAFRLDMFDDPAIDLNQSWLDRYELEYYLHYHALRGRHRVVEVPVSMVYPESKRDYSKIRPFIGWWSMVRPWLLLRLGLKR